MLLGSKHEELPFRHLLITRGASSQYCARFLPSDKSRSCSLPHTWRKMIPVSLQMPGPCGRQSGARQIVHYFSPRSQAAQKDRRLRLDFAHFGVLLGLAIQRVFRSRMINGRAHGLQQVQLR